MIPGLTIGNLSTDSIYDDEMIRKIMEQHYMMMTELRELEFSKKVDKSKLN